MCEELLQLQFTTGADTIFEGIQRVLPGETVTCVDGRVVDRRRISHLPEGGPENIDEDEALKRLDRALEESVDLHQRSDVPYGMFLSGGIDSATIIALMSRLNSEPVLAFTAGFDVPEAADERDHAAAVAKAVGAHHEPIEVTEAMVWQHLPEIVACMDDPTADYAIIPTWFLARRARQDVKVVLSGEGGDEIFAGYSRYASATRPWWFGGRAMYARGSFDLVSNVLRTRPTSWRDGIVAAEVLAAQDGRSRLAAAQVTDMVDWLPHDLLLKLDRCLMAHAVEGRTPFLDPGVAAAAFRLPDSLKLRQGMGKWILRKWLEKNLPMARPFAPKQGFTVPVGQWIKEQGARLGPLVAAAAGRCGNRPSRPGGLAVSRDPALAAWQCRVEAAVLRAVAPPAHSGPAASGGCVRHLERELSSITVWRIAMPSDSPPVPQRAASVPCPGAGGGCGRRDRAGRHGAGRAGYRASGNRTAGNRARGRRPPAARRLQVKRLEVEELRIGRIVRE